MVFGSLLKNIFVKTISKFCSVWYNRIGQFFARKRIKNIGGWRSPLMSVRPCVEVGGAMRKYLTQAMLAESISRLEDAARTQAEFENVIEWWDKRDKKIRDALTKRFCR